MNGFDSQLLIAASFRGSGTNIYHCFVCMYGSLFLPDQFYIWFS